MNVLVYVLIARTHCMPEAVGGAGLRCERAETAWVLCLRQESQGTASKSRVGPRTRWTELWKCICFWSMVSLNQVVRFSVYVDWLFRGRCSRDEEVWAFF